VRPCRARDVTRRTATRSVRCTGSEGSHRCPRQVVHTEASSLLGRFRVARNGLRSTFDIATLIRLAFGAEEYLIRRTLYPRRAQDPCWECHHAS
jgi:hypothetical protein